MITHCPIAHIKFRNYAKIIFDLGFTEKFIGTTHEKLSVLQTTNRLVNTRFHQEIWESQRNSWVRVWLETVKQRSGSATDSNGDKLLIRATMAKCKMRSSVYVYRQFTYLSPCSLRTWLLRFAGEKHLETSTIVQNRTLLIEF